MNQCNRCKRKGQGCGARSGEKGRQRKRNERGETQTGRDESREVRAAHLLGRSQPSSRRSVVELPCREDTRHADEEIASGGCAYTV